MLATDKLIHYHFTADVWVYPGNAPWYFVCLPQDMALSIRTELKFQEQGWGRMKAIAQIGKLQWETSIWFSKQHLTYLLAIKAAIRIKENIKAGDQLAITIFL